MRQHDSGLRTCCSASWVLSTWSPNCATPALPSCAVRRGTRGRACATPALQRPTNAGDADRRDARLSLSYSAVQPKLPARRFGAPQHRGVLWRALARRRRDPTFALSRMLGTAEVGDTGQTRQVWQVRSQTAGDRRAQPSDPAGAGRAVHARDASAMRANTRLFGGDRDFGDIGIGAGPGRPGQVIRLHRKTRQRHLDWLTWGLLSPATAQAGREPAPIHTRGVGLTHLC